MNCVELSLESLKDKSIDLCKLISENYSPDIVIFIAKGGYLIAKPIADNFNVPIIGIDAVRSGNKLKEILVPILSCLPDGVKNFLRAIELKSNVHDKKTLRNVAFHENINSVEIGDFHKVLVVDDSVDTGHSMKAVLEEIVRLYPDSEVKFAALNVWSKSESVIKTDFTIYKDTIIKTPMSKDSKEYSKFIEVYNEYLKS